MNETERRDGRRRLMDAALELFAERGYEATSIADIARRSGVSRGSVPWHFANKAGLLAAVLDRETDAFLGDVAEHAPDDLDAAVDALTRFTQQPSSGMFVSLLAESVRPDSVVRSLHADLHERIIEAIEERLDRLAPTGSGTTERRRQATLALSVVIGTQQQWRIAPDRVDVPGTYRLFLSSLNASAQR